MGRSSTRRRPPAPRRARRANADGLVLELLVELLAELDRVRSPLAWIETAVARRAIETASNRIGSAAAVDLDAIFGRTP